VDQKLKQTNLMALMSDKKIDVDPEGCRCNALVFTDIVAGDAT